MLTKKIYSNKLKLLINSSKDRLTWFLTSTIFHKTKKSMFLCKIVPWCVRNKLISRLIWVTAYKFKTLHSFLPLRNFALHHIRRKQKPTYTTSIRSVFRQCKAERSYFSTVFNYWTGCNTFVTARGSEDKLTIYHKCTSILHLVDRYSDLKNSNFSGSLHFT